MAVKTFTSERLTSSDVNTYLTNSGLVYVGGGTLSAVTNSFSNVFSSTYENYRIVLSNLNNGSGSTRQIYLRMRTSSDDTSANYFYTQHYIFGANITNTVSFTGQTEATLFNMASGTNGSSCTFDITGPNTSTITTYHGQAWTYQSDVAAYVYRAIGGCMNTTTQYTGFSITGVTDNLSGTVRIYGYRQA